MSRSDSEDGIFSEDQTEAQFTDGNNRGNGNGRIVLKKGPWTSAEDEILVEYVKKHGEGNWNAVQKNSGLFRCGKSCRLRWSNHLRPNLKKGAFTPEEESLIVELHAKMGNKWSRMAALLPGRTDNEIKNHWNTRIKRCQRLGLPLYPPELSLQASQESQQGHSSGALNGTDRAHHDSLESNTFEIPDVVFDSLKGNHCVLPYVPELPYMSTSGMRMTGLGSSPYCGFMPPTIHRQKRPRESAEMFPTSGSSFNDGFSQFDQYENDACDKVDQPFGLSFPPDPDPDPTTKSPPPFGVSQGSHSLSNGNSSACRPTCGAEKLELPSLQYPETNLGSWSTPSPNLPLLESVDYVIQSPPPVGAFESNLASIFNSGLVDALLQESMNLSSTKNHSTDMGSNLSNFTPGEVAESSTLNVGETEWDSDPISPLGHSATSLFTACTPISMSGSSLEEALPAKAFTGSDLKPELADHAWTPEKQKESSHALYYSIPDAFLGSDWFEPDLSQSMINLNDASCTSRRGFGH